MKQKVWTNWLQVRRLINSQKPPNKQEPMIRSLHWWILPNIQRRRPILLKFFQKIKEEGTLSNSFYEPALHWCQNQTSMPQEKNYRLKALMNINAKILNQILTNHMQQYIHRIIHHDQVGFIPGIQRWFDI